VNTSVVGAAAKVVGFNHKGGVGYTTSTLSFVLEDDRKIVGVDAQYKLA
jgi:hypothetical protein